MKPRNENSRKKVKRFEDLLPKFDDGTTDWETAKNRLSQNMSAAEMFLGKMPPQALDIEETVLGACLIDPTAYAKVKEVLSGFATPFYKDVHNVIWTAMSQLAEQNEPIDRHTLWQAIERMQQSNLFQDNPYYLLELTEKVSSSGHVESHARILLDKCLRRRIMHMSVQLFQKAFDPSTDLFDLMDEQKAQFQTFTHFNPLLKAIEMPKVMEMAQRATPKSEMMGSLLKKGDVGILFSSAGNGKSILGIQCADNLSKGQSAFGGMLRNECGPQVVAYFDMELSLSDYQNRYIDAAGNPYPFAGANQFVRVGNDDEQSKTFAEIARNIERILIQNIERIRPNVVIIDNITAISNGSTADAVVAAKIMDLLMLLKKRFQLTILMLAHTPKRYDLSKPLVLEDLAGSSLFLAYADSIIAIGASKMGSNIKYLKHIKVRSGVKIHDENNVIQVAIVKEGAFLHMKTLEEPFGRESDHLISKNEVAINDELIRKMVELHTEGKSLQEIRTDLKIDISRQHIGRILKTQQEKKAAIHKDFDEALKEENPF